MSDRRLATALVLPATLVLAVFAYLPISGSIVLSFQQVVLTLPGLGEAFVGFENYRDLFESPVFRHSLATTLVFVVATTTIELVLGLGLALCLHGVRRGRGLLRAAALVPWAVPTVVASQMWRFLFNDRYGAVTWYLLGGETPLASTSGALAAVIVADVWKTTPFAALILLAGLQVIPQDVDEAAEIDGAGPVQRFFRVTLPLLRPAILVALLFRTIDAFRVFDLVFVMTEGGPADATNVLQFFGYKRSFAEGLMGSGAAVSTLVFLLTFAISIFYVRLVGATLWKQAR